jgi:hypothetical protein
MSLHGAKRASRPGLTMSVHRRRADSAQMALHSEFDPNATMDAWKDGGAPRCRAGLEYLTPSAQLMPAGPPLLMWIKRRHSGIG